MSKPITPQEARAKAEEAQVLDFTLVDYINARLVKEYGDQIGYIVINERDLAGKGFQLDAKLGRSIVKAYKASGWDVKYESDQRDGSFVQFYIK